MKNPPSVSFHSRKPSTAPLAVVALLALLSVLASGRLPAQNGPYQHRIHSASSADGLTWTRDPGVRLQHASVPCAVVTNGQVFLYYVDADRGPGLPESVGCAVSTDATNFVKQPFTLAGMTTTKVVDPSILIDDQGRFRLYSFASSASGDPASDTNAHQIQLALSDDGIHFTNQGVVFSRQALVDPDVFVHNGAWFMYVFGQGQTEIATSPDGLAFTYLHPLALPGWGTVAPIRLADGRLRLYAFDQTMPAGNAVRSFISTNALDWTMEAGHRLLAATNEQITDPFVVRWQGGYKMFFKVSDAMTNQPPQPTNGNVTVTFPGRPYRPAAGGTSGFFQTGQEADLMLAGIDFNNTGGGLLFNHPGAIASDGTRVLLADRNNNRVLIWLAPPKSNTPPHLVLGQPDFTQNNPGTNRNQLNWPCAVSVAANGRVVVADTDNDRLLLWNTFPTSNAAPADLALPLRQFTPPGRPLPFMWPWGAWTDGTRLVASATQGGALLFWNTFPTASNSPPSFILTNASFGTLRTITSDGTFLAVDDHNAPLPFQGVPFGHATFFWTNFPASANAPWDFAIGGRYRGGKVGGKLVMLGEGRMKIWNSLPLSSNTPPAQDLSGAWGSDGDGLTVAGGCVFTMDENQNAILGFNALPANATGAALADFAVGSPHPLTNTLRQNFFIQNPVPVSNGTNLFVSSDFDRRLYVWRNLPDQSGAWPDVVYSFSGGSGWANALRGNAFLLAGLRAVHVWNQLPLNGELPVRTINNAIGNAAFNDLRGVALDGSYFYLADYQLNKVWAWAGGVPATNANPTVTLDTGGRATRISSDGTYLAVAVEGPPHAVKIYRVATLAGTNTPLAVVTQAQINLPQGCLAAAGRLFIPDTSNSRLLIWSRIDDAIADGSPDVVLGANDLLDRTPEIGRNKLFMPGAASWDGTYLWVGEFKFSSRLLRYSPSSGASGPLTLTGPLTLSNGRFNARVTGAAGQRFELQSSTDLSTWRSDGFRNLPTNGTPLDVAVLTNGNPVRVFLRTRGP